MAKRRRFTPDYPTSAQQETPALGIRKTFDPYQMRKKLVFTGRILGLNKRWHFTIFLMKLWEKDMVIVISISFSHKVESFTYKERNILVANQTVDFQIPLYT